MLLVLISLIGIFDVYASGNLKFSGVILNNNSEFLTLKINNSNIKFFKNGDEVFFFNKIYADYKCRGIVEKGNRERLILKVTDYTNCKKYMSLTANSTIDLESNDLLTNLSMAKDVENILLKKKMILEHKVLRLKKDIKSRNLKYQSIEQEYEEKIASLSLEKEEKKQNVLLIEDESRKQINDAKLKLIDIDKKLQLYRVEDQRYRRSQWSLKSSDIQEEQINE